MPVTKSKNIDVVLFDLGNTLLYFDSDWSQVVDQTHYALVRSLQLAGFALDTQAFISQFQYQVEQHYTQHQDDYKEITTASLIRSILNDWGYSEVTDDVLRQASQDMNSVSYVHWIPEEDALPTLERLRRLGYRLGLISNASDDADLQLLIDKGQFRHYFDVILTSAAQGIRKPNPAIFLTALSTWGAQPERAVMVGDKLDADIRGAHNTGITSIWITRRADSLTSSAKLESIVPDVCIATLSELPGLLTRL